MIGRYGQDGDFKEQAYWIPEAFADDLMQTQKIFSDDGFVKEFVNKFSQVQGVWKMYALMSPGYHMRNLYSNLFQNFIGGVTNPKRYMEAMAIQAGGTNNLPVGVRHAVEAVVGRKGVDDVIFESNGKSWTIREAQEHGNKSGTTTQGMFAQDIPIELERDMMKNLDRIENVQRVIINKYNFTKGADKMRQDAIAAGSDPEVATHNAQIGNAMAHNWALKNGKDPEEWWYKFNVKDLTERQPDAYWGQELFRISDEEFGEPAYQLYGKLEEAMQGVFTSHGVDGASAATLKKELSKLNRTPGGKNLWRSIYDDAADMVDPSVLMDKIQRILELDMGNDGAFKMHKWYKEFGDGVADTVGEQNMPEFAGVFAIMSPQRMVEQDLAESIYVMRKVRMLKSSGQTFNKENFLKAINEDRVRTSTTKTGQMSDQAQKIYLSGKNNIEEIRKDQAQQLWDFYSNEVMGGGLKTTNFAMTILHRQKSDFFPGVVNDVQMAKQFGFHKNGKHIFNPRANHAQYRYAQNVVAQIAKTLDISPDEAMAALWYDAKLSDDFTREVLDDGTVLRKMDKTPKGRLGENWPHADTGAYDTEGRILSRIGSWESASAHSKPELDMARAMGMADSESLIASFDYDEVLKLSDEGASRKDILRILAKKFSDEGFNGPEGALYQAQPSSVKEAQDILGRRMGDLFNEDPSLQTVATGTSRKLHETTATSKALMETIDPDNAGAVLDFGAGKSALQSGSLRKSGYNVTSHDFGDNVKEGVHDPDALTRQYDTVMASNMINTQGSDEMLDITLDQLQIATKSGGRLILNLPISPRKGAWQAVDGAKAPKELREADVDKLVNNLSERYEQVEIISGTPASGPVIMASNPKKGGFDREVMGKRLGIKDDALYQEVDGPQPTFNVDEVVPELKNADGTLVRLYHGTDQVARAKTDQFGDIKPPSAKGPKAGEGGFKNFRRHARGTWVTSDPKEASNYGMSAGNRAEDIGGGESWAAEKIFGKPIKELLEGGVVKESWGGKYTWDPPTAGRVVPVYANVKKMWRVPEDMKKDFYASGDASSSFSSQADAEKWAINQAIREGADAIDHGGGVFQIVDPKILESAISPGKKGGLYQMSGGKDSTWGNKLRGAIWKDPDFNVGDYTNYIIGLHRDNQNATTLAHEMGHLFRLTGDIPTDQKKALDKFVGADSSLPDMGVEAEEKFARAWESFLMEGKTPTPGLREVFHDMKSKFEDVYNTVPPEQIDNNIKSVFDSMFDRIRPQEYAEYAVETIGEKSTYEKTVESMKRFGRKRFGIDSWQVQKNMAMGRHMENNSRMAHWLQKMLDGNTVEASDSSVRKYLFDYDELTEFEKKVMRNIIPFYTWSRKNIPLQIQAVFEDPARYQLAPKMMEMIEQFSHEWGDIEGPDYFQQQHMLRLPLMYNEQPAFINPDLPFQSLQDIRVDPFVAGMTPFAKWMTEWWPKHAQSMFTDRPIERYPGEPSALIPGIDKKTEVNLGNIFPTLGKIQRLAQAASRGEAGAQLSGEITGLRIMPVDEQKVARSKRFQKREVLRRVKRKIRDLEEQDEPVKRVKRGRPRKED